MTKNEARMIIRMEQVLVNIGFTMEEIGKLRRASRALHRWHEGECDGDIERDEVTDKPFRVYGGNRKTRYPLADKETGARKGIGEIVAKCNARTPSEKQITAYIQTDPRGCALYLIPQSTIDWYGTDRDGREVDIDAIYSQGIAVY